jgi:hypothetical protein
MKLTCQALRTQTNSSPKQTIINSDDGGAIYATLRLVVVNVPAR